MENKPYQNPKCNKCLDKSYPVSTEYTEDHHDPFEETYGDVVLSPKPIENYSHGFHRNNQPEISNNWHSSKSIPGCETTPCEKKCNNEKECGCVPQQPQYQPPCNIISESGSIPCTDSHFNPSVVTDEFLLNYLLKKYKLDKIKLINSIIKHREIDAKLCIMRDFYDQNKKILFKPTCKPFKEQYKIFKEWNCSGIYICKEELEDYYENHVK